MSHSQSLNLFTDRCEDQPQSLSVHEWKLNLDEMQQFQDGKIGDYLKCSLTISSPIPSSNLNDQHENEHFIKWNISLYPLGHDTNTADYSQMSLFTRSIPSNLRNIIINYNISVEELEDAVWTENAVDINNRHLLHILQCRHMIHSETLKSCNSITFKISISIDRVIPKPKVRPEPPRESIPSELSAESTSNSHRYNKYDLKYGQNTRTTPTTIGTMECDEEKTEEKAYQIIQENDGKTDETNPFEIMHDTNPCNQFETDNGQFPADRNDKDDDNYSEFQCFPECITPIFDHRIVWTIRGKQLGVFLHCPMRECMETNPFLIDGLSFKLAVFPNGHKERYNGFVIMYLDMIQSETIKNVRIHWSIRCPQTGTRSTSTKVFNRDRCGAMVWLPTALKIDALKQMHSLHRIHFVLDLSIHHIEYHSANTANRIHPDYQSICHYRTRRDFKGNKHKLFCHETSRLRWTLGPPLFRAIHSAECGQPINSPSFGIWTLRLNPKGIKGDINNLRDKFVISLKASRYDIHRDIAQMVVRVMVNCHRLKLKWNEIATIDSRNKRECGQKWDISECLKQDDFWIFGASDRVTLEVTVTVLKLFGYGPSGGGPSGKMEIGESEFYKYVQRTVDSDGDQLDEEMELWRMKQMIEELQSELMDTQRRLKDIERDHKKDGRVESENVDHDEELKECVEQNDVRRWFENMLELAQYMDCFENDGYDDFQAIVEIKDQDLKDMNIEKKGHRIKILKSIERIKQFVAS